MDEISNSEDFINSSDIPLRIADLERMTDREDWDEDELTALRELYNELEGIFGAGYLEDSNPTLVRESYFTDYARTEADDIGDIREEGSVSPFVDWKAYANAVQQDWSDVSFDGVTYLVRG